MEQFEDAKRYEPQVCGSGGDYWPEMVEYRYGEYRLSSDYETLLNAYKELKHRMEGLEK